VTLWLRVDTLTDEHLHDALCESGPKATLYRLTDGEAPRFVRAALERLAVPTLPEEPASDAIHAAATSFQQDIYGGTRLPHDMHGALVRALRAAYRVERTAK
jgi:hypothetical protein